MIETNRTGESHARELIRAGKIDRGPWSFDAADGNALLGPEGNHWSEYARFHLAIDTDADEDTKARWKYPYGKDGKVYVRALSAIRSRASQEGATSVYDAAGKLLDEAKGDSDEKDGEAKSAPAVKDEKSAPSDAEKRCLMASLQLRNLGSQDGSPGTIVGYAAVFDRFSQDLGYFREKIAPGAFSDCLSRCDVRALRNHDPSQLLARSTNGTLRMIEDSFGLRVEIDLPATQAGRDAAYEVRTGLMDGMSFSFTTDVDQWDYSGETPIRTLLKVRDLFDVGPVTYPAYTDTSAAMRSMERGRTPTESRPRGRHHVSLAKARLELAEAMSGAEA